MRVCSAGKRLASLAAALLAFAAIEARADHKPNEAVTPFAGSLSQSIPIAVPAFRGLEPRLALSYSSERRNGQVGVGWALSGLSRIDRVSAHHGTPRLDATDLYMLDGQELVACAEAPSSPSCTSGGSYTTKSESYLKIGVDDDIWTVLGKDGTRTLLSSMRTIVNGNGAMGIVAWGQLNTTDTHGNMVTYTWERKGDDFYPESVSYGSYSIRFYWETRPDVLTFATGEAAAVGKTSYRLRSILVSLDATAIRAYKLTYTSSPLSGRSLLGAVQQYGKDVVIDGDGAITAGTALPARTFTYQGDASGATFQPWGSQ